MNNRNTKILLIGQCTLHWGRMEFGNIGNYYIIEPFIRELKIVFPECEIKTTFQMSDEFCQREGVECLPMSLYYSWKPEDLDLALVELASARMYSETGFLPRKTPYIEQVLASDIIVDFSGDIWGDNADFLGENRFFVGLCKDRVAQYLKKPVVMLAGSPGPFGNQKIIDFAKETFAGFQLVTNREAVSKELLKKDGFDVSKVVELACPAFLFEPGDSAEAENILTKSRIQTDRPVVGFIVCGWNFLEGPFDKKDRDDSEYDVFAEAVEYLDNKIGAEVCLMSHSNGFHSAPAEFELIHGRDYPIIKQLQSVLTKRGRAKNFFALDGIYDTWTTKAIIGKFDMLVSGRVHGAVAGLSQFVPTVIIDYGHPPKAHKLSGFAKVAEVSEFLADPAVNGDINASIRRCWEDRIAYKRHLRNRIPEVQDLARENFRLLSEILNSR